MTLRSRKYGVIRWICAGIFVCLGIAGYLAYQHYTDPLRICRLAEDYLEQITQRKVRISSASFSFTDGISLRDVYISNQPLHDEQGASSRTADEEVFSCHEIFISQNSRALLRGQLEIESFAAIRPTLTLVHDDNAGWAEVASLVRTLIAHPRGTGSAPPIELRLARVRVIHRSSAGDRDIEDIQLTVRGRQATDDPRLFNVVWQDANDPDANGQTQIDLATGCVRNVRGGIPTISMRGVMLAVDAGFEGANGLTDLLGIEGRVRVRDYNLMAPPLHGGPRSATVDLKNASISIPISDEERGVKSDERYLRFDNVNGTVTATASNVRAEFDALFHASPCKVIATIEGPLHPALTLADVSMTADVAVTRLELPDRNRSLQERRFVQQWASMEKIFNDYDPHGKVDVHFQIEKAAGEKEPFIARKAFVTLQGTNASCDMFPYRVERLYGTVEFDAQGLFVRDVCGSHDSAKVCVNGWLEAPTRHSLARFAISGADLPIDDQLLAALHPNEQRWVKEFGLSGHFNTEVSLTRERSPDDATPAPWMTTIGLSFDDLGVEYAEVPMPVTHLLGRATIQHDQIEINQADGIFGTGSIRFHGLANLQPNGLGKLQFQVAADDVAIDDTLLKALPQNLASRIVALNVGGCASTQTELIYDDHAGWRHETLANVRNMTLKPHAFPLPVDRGLAELHLDSDRMEILRARGYYKDAELFAKGLVGLGGKKELDLVVEAGALSIDPQFRDAVPDSLRNSLSDWSSSDPINAEIRVQESGHGITWNGNVKITDAPVYHRLLPRPLDHVDATVFFTNEEVRSTDARGSYNGSPIEADFRITHDGTSQQAQIRLGAKGLSLDGSIRGVLPAKAQSVWDELSPAGRIDLSLDDLSFSQEDTQQQATWSVRGQTLLHDAKLCRDDLAVQHGTLSFDGMLVDRLGGITLNGTLQDVAARIYDQQLTDATANWYFARTAAGEGRAAVRDFRGSVHGGTATTQAQLAFDPGQAQYRLATSLQNVDLASWLESWRGNRLPRDNQSAAGKADKPTDVRGIMDAQFHIAGSMGNPMTRTGGGRVEIRDGYIYRLPIFLAILNVLDITVPNNDVLSEARGQFYVTGNTVRVADIAVSGESLSLVGQGTMSLADQSVDLTLVNAGAGRLSGIPVLAELWEGASRELVELRVTGPLSQPQVRASPFRGVTDELKKLFQKRKPKRSQQAINP